VSTVDLSEPSISPPAAPARAARILVVDDVEANLLVLSKMVRVLGHVAVTAPDAITAIAAAKKERPDLILMDVMMPGVDGIEATRRLKADPDTRLVPVVVVTALTESAARRRAIEAGADDFISKPVDGLELGFRVKALLAVKRTYDELEEARAKAAEADRLKTEFLSSVSHELRTPLTAISSAARILVKHGAERPEALAKFAPIIVEQSARLSRLLDEVLDLAKLEAGGTPFGRAPVDVAALASSVAATFDAIASEKGISLRVELRPLPEGTGWVSGDRDRLTQVLVNLLSNAVKFTPPGGAIRIAVARVSPEEALRWGVTPLGGAETEAGAVGEGAGGAPGAVLVAVEDTGPGIAPENQQLVFEKFRQVADAATGKPAGTGLGLTISREIVERFGGRIGVRSAPGQGSRFTVALPECAAPDGKAA
jgi:signal transduction histidine kinase